MARVTVSAAVMVKDGKILIARRGGKGRFADKWEFPGGKVEQGETPKACVERELLEELGIRARAGQLIGKSRYDYGHMDVELWAYRVSSFRGQIRLTAHEEIRWVRPDELADFDFPEADRPIIEKLMEGR